MGLKNTFTFPVPPLKTYSWPTFSWHSSQYQCPIGSLLILMQEKWNHSTGHCGFSHAIIAPNSSCWQIQKHLPLGFVQFLESLHLVFMAKSRHLAVLAILDPVYLGGKYPGPLPRCSWMTCKRGQSPRYLQPFVPAWQEGGGGGVGVLH